MRAFKNYFILAVLLLFMAGYLYLGVIFVLSIPVYPSREREVDSYKELKVTVQKKLPDIVFPDLEDKNMENVIYTVYYDGRGRLAKPDGYKIGGFVEHQGISYYLSVSANTLLPSTNTWEIMTAKEQYQETKIATWTGGTSIRKFFIRGEMMYSVWVTKQNVEDESGVMTEEEYQAVEAMAMDMACELIDLMMEQD